MITTWLAPGPETAQFTVRFGVTVNGSPTGVPAAADTVTDGGAVTTSGPFGSLSRSPTVRLTLDAAVVGTNADKALYVTPSGRFTGRTALVLGIKYSF